MKFLIQKIDKEVRHDFSFTLLESIRYQKWFQQDPKAVTVKYVNCLADDKVWFFKPYHEHYVPVGSVEFVLSWMKRFGVPTPPPMNIPEVLINYSTMTIDCMQRKVFNGNHMDIEDLAHGKYFVKTNDRFKGFAEVLRIDDNHSWSIPAGNYQISEHMDIKSEWRAFVYKGELVGLQNYSGDFTRYPSTWVIKETIKAFTTAPIAYTLDVGVGKAEHHKKYGFHLKNQTFVIECHDFFSCGLYGFAEHKIYPYMLYRWFHEYLNKNRNGK